MNIYTISNLVDKMNLNKEEVRGLIDTGELKAYQYPDGKWRVLDVDLLIYTTEQPSNQTRNNKPTMNIQWRLTKNQEERLLKVKSALANKSKKQTYIDLMQWIITDIEETPVKPEEYNDIEPSQRNDKRHGASIPWDLGNQFKQTADEHRLETRSLLIIALNRVYKAKMEADCGRD